MCFTIQADSLFPPPATRRYYLELLYVPDGLVDAPAVGTRWGVPLEDPLTLTLPTYRATSGEGAYRLAFTATEEVPEPNSAILLLSCAAIALGRCRTRRAPAADA